MLRAAVIQMVSSAEVAQNLGIAEELIAGAAADRARLVALPEFFALISPDERDKLAIREAFGAGPIQSFLSERARRHGIWLLGGTVPLESGEADRVYNSSLLFNDQGECVARYDKIHLFDVYVDTEGRESYNESATMKHGQDVTVAETPFGNLGMSVCYDLRFPELYRRMLERNVVMIGAPSAFTEKTGRKHWELLLRARAVENLSFVIAPAQGGRHNEKRATWGHSMIVDPWGEILCSLDTGPGFVCADLDLEHLAGLRRRFPALEHRKLAV
ncbi:MAG: carbon-nitrogen hydrolase family protein [Gammaproteobacteria bacterium]|nr:carbon-nitrogen hydrolase family protein [Gammaproteobacteria bacterium]